MSDGKILLLGAGYTLQRLAARIGREKVILTTTSAEKRQRLSEAGYETYLCDLTKADELTEIVKKAQVIVDSVPPLRKEGISEAEALLGVRNVISALGRSNVARIIYLSTTGVFGGEDGNWVSEDTEPNPKSPQAKLRLLSEQEYQRAGRETTIVRISGIYGPGRGLGVSLQAGRYQLVDEGRRWTNRIHVEDLTEILRLSITISTLPILNASDDEPALAKDVVSFYCQRFGIAFPAGISLAEANNRNLHTMTGNQRVSNKLTKQNLNFSFRYPSFKAGAGTEFE